MRRLFVISIGVLALLTAGQASALSLLVVSSEVFVDTYARAETTVSDRPLKTAENIEIDVAVAIFVRQGSSSATASGRSERTPFLDRPAQVDSEVDLDVSAKSTSSAEAAASVAGGGSVRVRIEGSSAVDPAAALGFNIVLDSSRASGTEWSFSYLVFNETRGTTIFSVNVSNTGGTVPPGFVAPVGFGDIIRVEWLSEILVEASGGAVSDGALHFEASFGTTPVPEPSTFALVLGGLLALHGAQRRRL